LKDKKIFFDSKKIKFECLQCGYCCQSWNVISKITSHPTFNYMGQYTKNPKLGILLFDNEINKIKEFIGKDHTYKIKPATILWFKKYPVCIVISYQISCNEDGCIFYNCKTKKCSIYSVRPFLCRSYPITLSNKCSTMCKAIDSNVDISTYSLPIFSYNMLAFNFKRFSLIMSKLLEIFSNMLYNVSHQIHQNVRNNYKYFDVNNFVRWFRKNEKDTSIMIKLDIYQEEIKKIEDSYKYWVKELKYTFDGKK